MSNYLENSCKNYIKLFETKEPTEKETSEFLETIRYHAESIINYKDIDNLSEKVRILIQEVKKKCLIETYSKKDELLNGIINYIENDIREYADERINEEFKVRNEDDPDPVYHTCRN